MKISHLIKIVVQAFIFIAWWCSAVFGSAGRLTWDRGWICTALYLGGTVVNGIVIKRANPELMGRRENGIPKDTKLFDKIFLGLYIPLAMILPVVAGLDVVRFKWGPMPIWTIAPGVILFIASVSLIMWVMIKNPHAETSVRIQTERGHSVVTSGPYACVRHPMYVGLILLHFSQVFVLGSTCALADATLICRLFIWRTAHEDRTLRRELPGYEQYTLVTCYRLLPGIW